MSSTVNEVNGENLQDPPIKNPGYANGISVITVRVFTYKMAAEINWHRYGTTLHHCHHMYTVEPT